MSNTKARRPGVTAAIVFAIFGPLFCRLTLAEVSIGAAEGAIQAFRLDEVAADVAALPQGADRDYLEGIADNIQGDLNNSVRLLHSALPELRKKRPDWAAKSLLTIADDHIKLFHYAEAAAAYDDLFENFAGQLAPDQADGAENDRQLFHILSGAPPQSIAIKGPVILKTTRNRLGSLNTILEVNDINGAWLLDTGANMSVVTESYAKQLGLKLLPGVAETQASLTGIQNRIQVAVISTIKMDNAVLRDVVALVLPDKSLDVQYDKEGDHYQINAIIGYPVFQALGRITFEQSGELRAGYSAGSSDGGARMYMKALVPVIECTVKGHELPFSFDTGASTTQLLLAYYRLFRADAPKWRLIQSTSAGAGGMIRSKEYQQHRLELKVGERTVRLANIPIKVSAAGSAEDDLYGNLGQDLVVGFESFTIDFEQMRFALGQPLNRAYQ